MKYPLPAQWRARVVSVHDGDTLEVDVDRGLELTSRMSIRLKDVWAPELAEEGGREVRDFALGWVHDHGDGTDWPFLLITYRTPRSDVDLKTFDRYVGTLIAPDLSEINVAVQSFVKARGFTGGTGSS